MLKHEKKVVITVDQCDLDKFISEVYDKPFEFVADEEANNDSSYEFSVKKEVLSEYDMRKLNEFKATGKGQLLTGTLLADLCNKDLIEPGDYIIQTCW